MTKQEIQDRIIEIGEILFHEDHAPDEIAVYQNELKELKRQLTQ